MSMKLDLKSKFLDLLFPRRCPVCGKFIDTESRFCPECYSKFTLYADDFVPENASGFTACFDYDAAVKPAIMLLKDGVCGNADTSLGLELADKLVSSGIADKTDIIVPVPMSAKDKNKRSFNQSELICKVISKAIEVPVSADVLIKSRMTAPQKELNRQLRSINLQNAFLVVKPELIADKSVLVVDDICTTGSTLSEIALTLKNAGASAVYCAACCKTPKNE